ncbi:MAG: hypothetical protein P1U38_09715 [Aeromicrobium sp.]|uniref:hypothetical protein n=1 Tax=Aeromicrobium sp. TaxID=1871063 RepID=UPI0026201626|nr:hypothetical protein [Aeromicrobium sp.]MDF1705038.1 hypothetical protein [Aeromicrobium sp.]
MSVGKVRRAVELLREDRPSVPGQATRNLRLTSQVTRHALADLIDPFADLQHDVCGEPKPCDCATCRAIAAVNNLVDNLLDTNPQEKP